VTTRIAAPAVATAQAPVALPADPIAEPEQVGPGVFDADVDSISAPALRLLDENTPRIIASLR
jgi:hypothetical protein